jgi:hypothetical protein
MAPRVRNTERPIEQTDEELTRRRIEPRTRHGANGHGRPLESARQLFSPTAYRASSPTLQERNPAIQLVSDRELWDAMINQSRQADYPQG